MFDFIIYIIGAVVGAVLGAFCCYLFLRPKLNKVVEKNIEVQLANIQLNDENALLTSKNQELREEESLLKQDIIEKRLIVEQIIKNGENEKQHLQELKEQNSAHFEEIEKMRDKAFEDYAEELAREAECWRQQANEEYAATLLDAQETFQKRFIKLNEEYSQAEEDLRILRRAVEAAVEAHKRETEKRAAADFYKLNLSDEDKEEIIKLRSILPYLRDKEPLNKVIYKCYYEKPYTDLVGRVVGSNVRTGIYKITNINNGMTYVGQAVNIAERWRQHIKRGVGAEAPTRNKLYPAMLKEGVENFTFEIVEDCAQAELNEREQFWQDYFKSKEYGYSIK